MPAAIEGKELRIKVEVRNVAGLSTSSESVLIVVIADKPSASTSGPVSIESITTTDLIEIHFTEPETGGSPITNFDVQMDDGIGGGFTTVAGGDLSLYMRRSLRVKNLLGNVQLGHYDSNSDSFSREIMRGQPYRFRYRAKNVNGWGNYSPITIIYAARRPNSPSSVSLLTSDSSSMSVQINVS